MRQRQVVGRAIVAAAGVAAAIAIASPITAHAQLLAGEARTAFDAGKAAAQKGNWSEAYSQLRAAEKIAKASPDILRALAELSSQRTGHELTAVAWYRAYLAAVRGKELEPDVLAKITNLELRAMTTAGTLIEKAENATLNLSPKDRNAVLANAAVMRAKTGNTNAALAAISSMSSNGADKSSLDSAYSSIASACARKLDFSCADSFIRRSSDDNSRNSALSSVSSALVYEKRYSEAASYAEQTRGEVQARSYLQIARAQYEANLLDDARQSLRRSLYAFRNTPARYSIYGLDDAISLARSISFLDETMSIFSSGRDDLSSIEAMSYLAVSYYGEGKPDLARSALHKAAENITARTYEQNGTTPAFRLMHIASAINQPDIVSRLLSSYTATIRGNDDYAQSNRANALSAAGRFSEAESIASRLREANARKWAFDTLDRERAQRVTYLARAGRYDDALAQAAQIRDKSSADSARYNINSALRQRASSLIARDEFTAAEQIISLITDDYYRTSKNSEVESIRRKRLDAFVKAGNFSAAEAMLAQDSRSGTLARPRIDLAKAYIDRGDIVASRRALEAATGALRQISLRSYSPSDYATICSELAQLYIRNGEIISAVKILEAAGTTITAIPEQSSRNYALSTVANAWARLLDVQKLTGQGDIAANSRLAISIAMQISDASTKASALSTLAEKVAGTGEAQTMIRAVNGLPSSYSKDLVLMNAAAELAQSGKIDEARSIAVGINDETPHHTAFTRIANVLIDKGDWAGAIAVASDPRSGSKLFNEIAFKMLSAGLLEQATALETKFVDSTTAADSYFSTLGRLHVQNGNFDAGLKAALRVISLTARTSSLFSLADLATTLAGPDAARPFLQAAEMQYAGATTPKNRFDLCISTRLYTNFGNDKDGTASGAVIGAACLAEALALPQSSERLNALNSIAAAPVHTARSMPGGILLPDRPVLGRWLIEVLSSPEDFTRSYYPPRVAGGFAQAGAIEIALKILDTSSAYHVAGYTDVIRWLLDAGAKPLAQQIALKFAGDNQKHTEESARQRGFTDSAAVMAAVEDFALAEHFADRITDIGSRLSSYQTIARTAVIAGRNDAAIKVLDKAKRLLAAGNAPYFYSSMLALAADAGDKNLEDWLTPFAKQIDTGHVQRLFSARNTVIQTLLQWKQQRRAEAILAEQQKAFQSLGPADRWSLAPQLATVLAWAGNLGGLATLVLDAPLPAIQASLLRSAADGFSKAGKFDEARKSLSRSLEVLRLSRPDAAAWADYHIVFAAESSAPGHAEKLATEITDPYWQGRAIRSLIRSRFARHNLTGTIALLKNATPSPALDILLPRAVRFLAGKNDLETARLLIAKAEHPHFRDEARRQFALALARTGSAPAVLSEINAIESPMTRAYTLADAGAALGARSASGQSELGYFSQLSLFSAIKLADSLEDPVAKSDVLATVAHVRDLFREQSAEQTHQLAKASAAAVTDTVAREAALLWAQPLNDNAKLSTLALNEYNDWISYINYSLNDVVFTDIDAFIRTQAQKPAADASKAYLDGAGKLVDSLEAMKSKNSKWQSSASSVR